MVLSSFKGPRTRFEYPCMDIHAWTSMHGYPCMDIVLEPSPAMIEHFLRPTETLMGPPGAEFNSLPDFNGFNKF